MAEQEATAEPLIGGIIRSQQILEEQVTDERHAWLRRHAQAIPAENRRHKCRVINEQVEE